LSLAGLFDSSFNPTISEQMNISLPNASNQPYKLKSSLVGESASIKKHFAKPVYRAFKALSFALCALKKPLGSNANTSDTFKAKSLTCKGVWL
jgi:hypothetical protein